jgi:hypothetical protein
MLLSFALRDSIAARAGNGGISRDVPAQHQQRIGHAICLQDLLRVIVTTRGRIGD